jgi:Leucyl aminopeptidase (aminopeptidase T)
MQNLSSQELDRITSKLTEFMQYSQQVHENDSYLIVNRNSPVLSQAAKDAAEKLQLDVSTYTLDSKTPYEHFPAELIGLLQENTPKAGMGLFDYSTNPDWNLKEVGARIELLHKVIEEVPISWAHSPGITVDMAMNGALQCDYREMVHSSEKLLRAVHGIVKLHITAPGGTDITVEIPDEVKFDTDCTIIPPNVYGGPGRFGNLPVGEVWSQKDKIIQVANKQTGKTEAQSYPVKHRADGVLVCDVAAGGYQGKIDPAKPLVATFHGGVLADLQCADPALLGVIGDIKAAEANYGLATVLEEVGIGLNEKARVTGNMLEDEKIRGTCHLAPGNVRCHVDMLVNKPTITGYTRDGSAKEIMHNGVLL